MHLPKLLFVSGQAAGYVAMVNLYALPIRGDSTIIDDCEGGSGLNKLGQRWYMYDDSIVGGNSHIKGTVKDANGEIVAAPTPGEGNGSSAGYTVPYQLGPNGNGLLPGPIPCRFVGIGTRLAADGSVCDITGFTSITFWAKADPAITVNVEIVTADVSDSGYYRKLVPVAESWTCYTILLVIGTGIAQPCWAKPIPFNFQHAQKLQWQIHSDNLPMPAANGTLNLDDIVLQGGIEKSEVCMGCLTLPMPANKALLSDFDVTPFNGNAVGGLWYFYNDSTAHQNPPVTMPSEFSYVEDGINLGPPKTIKIDGHGKTGNGAYIGFQLGPTFKAANNVDLIKPFVGIGTKLCDTLETKFYNATVDECIGVAFDYKITGVDYLRLEVASKNFDSKSDIVWYRLFPRKPDWQTAVVPFDSLMLPKWTGVDPCANPLLKDALKSLQWEVKDDKGKQGTIAIDNVYFIGGTKLPGPAVIYKNKAVALYDPSASLANRNLHVSFPTLHGTRAKTVSLVTIKGTTVASKAGSHKVSFDVSNVANGMYFCVVKTNDASGQAFTTSIPVTIFVPVHGTSVNI